MSIHKKFVTTAKLTVVGIASLLGLAASGGAQALSLVQNGSFTATTLASPGGYICTGTSAACAVSSNITNWTSTCQGNTCGTHATPDSLLFAGTNGSAFNGNIGLYSVTNAPLGGNVVALDGAPQYSATISQTINGLVIGGYYDVSFYEAGGQQSGQSGDTVEDFKVSLGTTTLTSDSVSTPSKGFSGWKLQNLVFKATGTSEVLSFLGEGTPAGEPPVALLGDVSLTAVPEPASWALMIVGVAGVGGTARYRRRTTFASNVAA